MEISEWLRERERGDLIGMLIVIVFKLIADCWKDVGFTQINIIVWHPLAGSVEEFSSLLVRRQSKI